MDRKATLLIADADGDLLRASAHVLEGAGYAVPQAPTVEATLELTRRHKPELILLDASLAGPDAGGLCRQIKNQTEAIDVLVALVMNAETFEAVEPGSLSHEADAYIVRPFSDPELLARVASLLRTQQTEARLRQSEQRYRDLVEQTRDCVWRIDPEGRFTFVSPAAKTLSGYDPDELIGASFEKVLVPEEVPKAHHSIGLRLQGLLPETGITIELAHRRKDGSTFIGEITTKPIFDPKGELIELAGITRDITQRHQLEEAYRILFENSLQGLTILQDGRFVLVNEAFAEMSGYTQEELRSIDPLMLVHPDDRALIEDRMQRRFRGEEAPRRYEFRSYRKDGSLRWMEIFATLTHYRGRQAILQAIFDITERKQAEAVLRETEERYRLVLEATSDGVWDWDIPSGRVTWSDSAFRQLGYEPDEFQPTLESWVNLLHPDDREQTRQAVTEALVMPDGNIRSEFRLRHTSGEYRWILGRGKVVERDVEGKPTRMVGTHSDITRRREMEQRLRASEERFRRLAEMAPLGIAEADADGRNTYLNEKWAESSGRSVEESRDMRWTDALHPDDREFVVALWKESVLAGKPLDIEYRIIRPDGETVWVRVLARATGFENGTPTGFVGTIEDITARKWAEEALQRYRHMLDETGHMAKIGGWEHDLDTGKATWTNALYEILEFDSYKPPGVDEHLEFYPEPDRSTLAAAYQKAIDEGEPFDLELRVHTAKGRLIWCRAMGKPIFRDETCVAVRGTFQDITDRKLAEEEVRKERDFAESLVETAQAIVLVLDTEGRIVRFNRYMEEVSGYRLEEVQGKDWFTTFLPERDRDRIRRLFAVARQGEPTQGNVNPIVTKDGREREIEWHDKTLNDTQGAPIGVLATGQDITDRLRWEEEQRQMDAKLQQAQKLESLGILAGGIAHDFNNLLVGILGNASLALMDLPENSAARECIGLIESSARQAADLTNQMLAYSGKGVFVVSAVDLSAEARESLRLCRHGIGRRIAVKQALRDDLPPVEADASQIRQVAMNLLLNAAEAIGDSEGMIALSTGAMHAEEAYLEETQLAQDTVPGEYAYLEVSDTGCGMDAETLSKIFDPFFTTKFTGRGLGLAATLGIIRGHKGAVHVESSPGEGTTFRVLFPTVETQAQSGEPAGSPQPIGRLDRSGLVLVVDDEPQVLRFASKVLERGGFEVLTAEDGQEALDAFRKDHERISAVLLDFAMPGLSGQDTFEQLRTIRPDIPIILSSGYTQAEATKRLAGKGLTGFIQKPYHPDELLEVLHRALAPR